MSVATTAPPPAAPQPRTARSTGAAGDWARRAPLLPALIFMIVVTQLPFVVTLVISFMNWNAYYPDERGFAGLDNYGAVFTDADTARRRSGPRSCSPSSWCWSAWCSGCGIALLLDRKFRGRGVVRTMMIAPFLVVPVAAALLWKHALYNPEYGLLNGSLNWVWHLFGSRQPAAARLDPSFPLLVDRSSRWSGSGRRS